MNVWVPAIIAYVGLTVLYSIMQAVENRSAQPGDKYWAPVWWVALTWPFWLVVIGFDLKVQGYYRRRK